MMEGPWCRFRREARARELIAINPDLSAEIEPLAKELKLRDGSASLRILPANDTLGAHGKSAAFIGFDEIHGYRDWSLLEALQPDPTRADALQWITSYASIYATTVGAAARPHADRQGRYRQAHVVQLVQRRLLHRFYLR